METIIRWTSAAVVAFTLIVGCSASADCQDISPNETFESGVVVAEAAADDGFHRGIIRAALKLRQSGEITRRDMLRLRVAMLAPAFRDRAKQVAVVQMAFSGEESAEAPFRADGSIDEAAIDWDGLAGFLERIVPLILKLLEIFAQMGLDVGDPSVQHAAIELACYMAMAA